jgi:hypothetical protein
MAGEVVQPLIGGPVVQPAAGTTLGCDFTTPATYVLIGNILSISGPEGEVGTVDTTVLTSTAKTFRPTLLDPGELTFELDFDPTDTTSHTKLAALASTPTIHGWQITYATTPAKTCTVQGMLTKFAPSAGGVEENLTANVTVKCSGAPTWT